MRARIPFVLRFVLVRLALVSVLAGLLAAPAMVRAQTENATHFEVERLNEGLGPAPARLMRETPQDALESFLSLTQRGRHDAAAHLLNLNDVEPQEQPAVGTRRAEMLAEVIDRRVVIDWRDLPSRPDALAEELPENHPFAGKPRRSLKIATLMIDGRPATIRINRVKPAEGDPVWVFAPQTVSAIPAMHRAYGPGWFESRLPDGMRADAVWGLRAWELVVLPVVLVLALGLGFVLRRLFGYASAKAPVRFIRRASEEVRTPLAVAMTAFVLQSVVNWVFSFSGAITVVLDPLLWALIIFGVTFAVLKTIDATLEVVTDRYIGEIDTSHDSQRRHFYTNIYALRRYVLLAAFVVGTVLLLYKLNLFESFGLSLLASAGIATVILGIAGQTVLGNILASLQIAIAKPIRIGDSVLYEGRWAYVEAIYYTYITLRTWDERRLIVPVKYFISSPFENWTMIDAKSTRTFALKLDLSAEPDVLREVFETLVREDEAALLDEMLMVTVEEHAEYTQTLRFYATAANPTDAWLMHARLNEKMGDWIRRNRPQWWPRMRFAGDGGFDEDDARAPAAAWRRENGGAQAATGRGG